MESAQNLSDSNWTLYKRLLGYLRPYWKGFALAVLGMIGTAATEPVFPAIMKHLLDTGFRTDDARMVWLIPLSVVLLFVARGVLSYCTGYLMTWLSAHLITDLRRDLFKKLQTLPSQLFHEQSAGKLISRLLFDVDNVNQAATNVLVITIRESLTSLALLAYLIYLDWKLTLITLCIAPVIALVVKSFGKRMRVASRQTLDAIRVVSHTIEEAVNSNKVIKIYGAQPHMRKRFRNDTERFRRALMREAIPSSATTPITHLAASVAVAAVIFLALSRTTGEAGASAGGFISFITAMLMLIAPIKQLSTVHTIMQRGLAACESVFEVLDTPSEKDHSTRTLTALGDIEFRNVSFQYPGSDRLALNGISFHAQAGQTVALVGASGGGKSTVSALIPRFYDPTTGQILIDGMDIQMLSLASLRSNIALVSQDIVLFNDTVAANIAFGTQQTCSRADIESAARAAHAWDFVQQLPEGLDTPIGEDGAKLSGGQRQRIAIARALIKNAPILILDEATSALDTESERQVQAALATLMHNRTTLVIAHRLSTIEHADKILVLNQGRIVESGTHDELVVAGGHYANLNRMQA